MITIKILGSGCSKCKALHATVTGLAAKHNIPAVIEKVEDLQEIMKYGILSTPGLVINNSVKSAGSVPNDAQLLAWMREGIV